MVAGEEVWGRGHVISAGGSASIMMPHEKDLSQVGPPNTLKVVQLAFMLGGGGGGGGVVRHNMFRDVLHVETITLLTKAAYIWTKVATSVIR